MDLRALFEAHVTTATRDAETALDLARAAGSEFDGIVLHAGVQGYYHADDRAIDFRSTPHFARFAPVAGPDHLLLVRRGQRPRLARVVPADFWYETPAEPEHPYANAIEPAALVAPLDWARGFKTPYEAACVRTASRIAGAGHRAVRDGMQAGWSERQLHAAYLEACGIVEPEAPYTNIIAWDDRAATLHYQTKRATPPEPGAVLLVDAGAVSYGYASDITRTYVRNGVHPVFRQALDGMEALQRDLVQQVRPGVPYLEIHEAAHRGVAAILTELGILRVAAAAAYERGLTRPFLPHGVGHHLGLQVHDVGGRQVSPTGTRREPPAHYPFLRTTRELAPGHVVTIEPGLYFIPMLLEPHRAGRDADAFDWRLIDALVPAGGIRIEDDILVTADGREDLTRPFVPGHRDAMAGRDAILPAAGGSRGSKVP
jgi:Xaa-Pro dipeptidase